VVPALLAAGHEVRSVARGARAAALPAEVERVRADVTDAASLRAAVEGCDACVHLVAIIVERGMQTYESVNVAGTAQLVRACEDAGVARFVHLSALGAGPDDRFPYLASKWRAEEIVRASTLDWTVLRPSVVTGAGSGFFRPIVWSLRWMPVYPLPAGGRTRFQPVAAADLAACVVRALDGAASRQTVDVGGPDAMDFRALVELTARALGKKRRMVNVPLAAARPFAFVQGFRKDPLVTNEQLDMVVLDNTCDPKDMARAFDIEPARMEGSDLRWLARL
jgi:uncharacterized protein YbjT (DUF2867 family)